MARTTENTKLNLRAILHLALLMQEDCLNPIHRATFHVQARLRVSDKFYFI